MAFKRAKKTKKKTSDKTEKDTKKINKPIVEETIEPIEKEQPKEKPQEIPKDLGSGPDCPECKAGSMKAESIKNKSVLWMCKKCGNKSTTVLA